MKKFGASYLLIYALLMIGGGIAGFAKAHSVPSLIAGVLSGTVLLGIHTKIGARAEWAFQMAAAVAGILCISMAQRYFKSHHFMPSGLILCLSILAVIVFLVASKAKDA